MPVQFIERLEIIKGPASSSWGSALGGVVNIVTKSPNEEKKIGGTVSFFGGERETRDSQGELAGTIDRFGYYLYGGNLTSNGFRPHTNIDENNIYAKLRWDLPERGSLLYTLGFTKGAAGGGQADIYDFFLNSNHHYFLSTLSLNYPINENTDFDVSVRTTSRAFGSTVNVLSIGTLLQENELTETTYGGSSRLTWRKGISTFVAGGDYDYAKVDTSSSAPILGQSVSQQHFTTDKWGVFANDTLTLGNFAVTPGIRFDRMRQVGNSWSPSFGATWSLDEKTILRAYTGQGYSLPQILPGALQEKVFTVQTGFETSHIPSLWLKTTLFDNYISDHQGYDQNGKPVLQRLQKQGIEVEAKTVPVFNTSLVAGYTFIDAKNRDTGALVGYGIPRQILKLGLLYNYQNSFRASLLGRYVWWNAVLSDDARDNPIIWDLNLAKKFVIADDKAAEIFFTGHNLFNGAQYPSGYFKNPRRWLEGGVRFSF